MWYFKSSIGVFWIAQTISGLFDLWHEDRRLGSFPSAEAAAESVSRQMTGWPDWDALPDVSAPANLAQWGRAMW